MVTKPFVGDRLGKRDLILATLAGFVFSLIYLVFSARGFEPELWGEMCVAGGLRPPQTIFPGVWRLVAKSFLSLFGTMQVASALNVLGAAVGGVCVGFAYLVIRQILAYLVRVRDIKTWTPIAELFAIFGTVCFGVGDSMWHVVSPFKPGTISLLALLFASHLFLRWLAKSGVWRILVVMFVAGGIASESTIGLILPFVVYLVYRLYLIALVNDQIEVNGDLPQLLELPKWRMFFSFVFGLALFSTLNIWSFAEFGGIVAADWDAFDITFHYATRYYQVVLEAATPIGWILALTFSVFPFIAALVLFPVLCRDSKPIDFKIGIILFLAGILALLQGGILAYTRLWSISSGAVEIRSEFLECIFSLFTAATIALASSCFRLGSENFFGYDSDDGKFVALGKRGYAMRHAAQTVVVLCLLPAVLRVYRPAETEMRSIVHDALVETVRECGDADFVFTDGKLDPGLELVASVMGSKVKPLNMMSGGSAWESYIRTRHFEEGTSDYDLAKTGVPVLLRVWAGEMTNGMDRAAAQLGFEFWRRARKPVPPQSGFVARTTGIDDAESKRGADIAKGLAARILNVAKNYSGVSVTPALRSAVSSVSWRISRFARMRDDEKLANELDEWNEAVKHMMRLVEYERMRTFMQMTPYEGLRLALRRADFAEARRYGATVLQIDPDDPEANFGTGMAFLMEEKFKEAEMYLTNTLKNRPDEPAVLNNLSIIFRKTNRLEKALEYVKRAHELMPANEEIQRTLKDTERAIETRKATLKSAFSR